MAGALILPNLAEAHEAQAAADVSAAALDIVPTPTLPAPAPTPAPAPPPPVPAAMVGEVLTAQVGTRVALRMQNPDPGSRDEVDDIGSDGQIDIVLAGQVHPFLKWQAGFTGSYGTAVASGTGTRVDFEGRADVLDLVAKLEIADAVNLWIGRMPIPTDRASLSTVWGLSAWTMPGVYSAYPLITSTGVRPWPGPRYGSHGRGDGVTFWGQLRGGRIKYYAGVFDLDKPNESPLYTARLGVSLLNPESGYRVNSGYYGTKNVLAVGIGGQHKADGSLMRLGSPPFTSSFDQVGADLLFEINGGAAGVLDLEGEVAKVWGDYEIGSYQFFALASYLVPIDVGIGRFQPLVRYQHAGTGKAFDAIGAFSALDAQLGYIIDGFSARLLMVYQYAKLQNRSENALLFGLQFLSHAK